MSALDDDVAAFNAIALAQRERLRAIVAQCNASTAGGVRLGSSIQIHRGLALDTGSAGPLDFGLARACPLIERYDAEAP